MMSEKFDHIAANVILFLTFLLPITFVPIAFIPQQELKLFLLTLGVLGATLLWGVARLRSNSITVPMSTLAIPLMVLPVVALLSSFFSGNVLHSLVGQNFSVDTVLMTFALSASFALGAFLFTSKEKVIKLYLVLVASAVILFIFQITRLFLGDGILSFNVLFGSTANVLGKWNDLAIFAGLITLLSAITLDTLRPHGLLKALMYLSLLLSLCVLMIVNFKLVWIILAVLSFVLLARSFFENKFSSNKEVAAEESVDLSQSNRRGVSSLSLLVCIVSVLFIFSGAVFEGYVSSYFGVSQIEARPSWQSTVHIFKNVYDSRPFFGAGPNNFSKEWLLNKPVSTNDTLFWNSDFLFGVGIIPTYFITNGLPSVITWIVFFGLFLLAGARMLMRLGENFFSAYLSHSSFFSALFLWIVSIFYVPHATLFFLSFLLSGVFLATQVEIGTIRSKTIAFNENVKVGFIGVISLFILIVLMVGGLYVSVVKFVSLTYVAKANFAASIERDLSKAQVSVSRAEILNQNDQVYRSGAEVLLLRFSEIINSGGNPDQVGAQSQSVLTSAIIHGQRAVSLDNQNYLNWVSLGRIYETLIPLKVKGAYDNAAISYEQVLALNPSNPLSELNLARISMLNGDNATAREHIAAALTIKPDFTEALFLLSQIEVGEGNVTDAISSVEAASLLTPSDPIVFFRLGLLRYANKDFAGAVDALERAVKFDPQYANAHYFLGLSYYETGRRIDASREFTLIKTLDPHNTEVSTIIENLVAGRAPLQNFSSTVVGPLEEGVKSPLTE